LNNYCEICNRKNLHSVLDLGEHPLCDDLIKIGSKKTNKLYKIEILFCKHCVTAYQKFQVKKKVLFPLNYHYRSNLTKDVLSGMHQLVEDCKKTTGSLKNKIVLDIGCNDGSLLNIFKKNKSITIGIEPTNACKAARKKGHRIFQGYIDDKIIQKIKKEYKGVDIITFTNVFAHIEDLGKLIKNLKKIIGDKTVLIIENHYLGSIIDKNQFDTFYHEHPRTYSLTSFIKMSKLLNMKLLKYAFPKRYGGNIRVYYSRNNLKNFTNIKLIRKEKNFFNRIKNFDELIKTWKKKKLNEILKLNSIYGPLPAKAFPGRAAILLKVLNLKKQHIDCIYEKPDSNKIGYYAPGTNIPIKSDNKLRKNINNRPLINLAWHIKNEIQRYLKSLKINSRVVNIIENKDFKK
jgi:2-polyprenyl-3-methyl-5-hydroxy-6-metoxy-1,4-benzoquinol methylase